MTSEEAEKLMRDMAFVAGDECTAIADVIKRQARTIAKMRKLLRQASQGVAYTALEHAREDIQERMAKLHEDIDAALREEDDHG